MLERLRVRLADADVSFHLDVVETALQAELAGTAMNRVAQDIDERIKALNGD